MALYGPALKRKTIGVGEGQLGWRDRDVQASMHARWPTMPFMSAGRHALDNTRWGSSICFALGCASQSHCVQASDEAKSVAFDILAAGCNRTSAADLHERLTAWICWALSLPPASAPSHTVTAIVQGDAQVTDCLGQPVWGSIAER